jgi:hypothetical protein
VSTSRHLACPRAIWVTAGLVLATLIWLATMALAIAFIADDTAAIGITMMVVTVGLTLALKVAHKSWTASLWAGAGVTLFLLFCRIGSMSII